MKCEIKNNRLINPEPWVIVSCRDKNQKDNALTVGLTGNVCVDPEILMISIKNERFSHHIIKEQKEFVMNFAKINQKEFIDYFGNYSGRVVEKLSCYNTIDADVVDAPIICDCPVNFECKVINSITMEDYEVFFAKVVKAHCDCEYVNDNGDIDWEKITPIHS